MRWAMVLLLAGTLGGCVQAEDLGRQMRGEPVPERWEESVEPSMAPDFAGAGASYPVLLVHQHHVPSERQKEEARRNPVVCFLVEGAPVPLVAPARREATACVGPSADPPTGRLFLDKERYLAERGRAVAVLMGSCSGGALVLGDARSTFEVQAPGHTFEVSLLPNGTFRVDGRWLAPGTALKVGWYLHEGDRMDEEYVRVVFDAPGEWLLSRMAADRGDFARLPPRPDRGSGLAVDVDIAPVDLAAPLRAILDATPDGVVGVAGLRAVHDGARLSELTVRVLTEEGIVAWYGAGRHGGAMRLLGALEPAAHEASSVDAERLLDALARPWEELRAGGGPPMVDVRLDPTTRWSTVAGVPLGVDRSVAPCEGECVFVRQAGGWAWLPLAERGEAVDAVTLEVIRGEGRGSVWWHAP